MTGEEYAIMKRRERQREYYQKNRDRRCAYYREYYAKNRDKIRERHTAYMREYRLKNSKPKEEEK